MMISEHLKSFRQRQPLSCQFYVLTGCPAVWRHGQRLSHSFSWKDRQACERIAHRLLQLIQLMWRQMTFPKVNFLLLSTILYKANVYARKSIRITRWEYSVGPSASPAREIADLHRLTRTCPQHPRRRRISACSFYLVTPGLHWIGNMQCRHYNQCVGPWDWVLALVRCR